MNDPYLEDVKWASRDLERAKEKYGRALRIARRQGYSNDAIGSAAGKTEAAIRMYLKRNKEGK